MAVPMATITRRTLLFGACLTMLQPPTPPALAADPLRVTLKIAKFPGKVVKVTAKAVIRATGFIWKGTLGVFNVTIGRTKTFVLNIAGAVVRLTIKVTKSIVRVKTRVQGFFGTLTDTVIKNI